MSIGLFDADVESYGLNPFNLELMKCATYYKKKREIVGFSPTFSPDRYTKFIYRKDCQDNRFDKRLMQEDNIEYGGLAFSNGDYIPLDKKIELCKPDVHIYDNYISNLLVTKADAIAFRTLQNAQHMRISLDNKTVWEDFLKPTDITPRTGILYFHDPDITKIDGVIDAIETALNHNRGFARRYIDTKYPIKVYTLQQLIDWLNLPLSKNCRIEFMGLLSNEEIVWIAKNLPQERLKHIKYNCAFGTQNTEEFVKKRLRLVFRQMVFLRSHFKYMTLIYSASILVEPQWVVVFGLMNGYFSSTKTIPKNKYELVMEYDSFYNFIKKILDRPDRFTRIKNTPQEMREAFKFIHDLDYDTFVDFYECNNVEYKGGELI